MVGITWHFEEEQRAGQKVPPRQKGIARNAFITWLQADQMALSPRGWFDSLSGNRRVK